MTITEKLQAIRAKCVELLVLAEKRTPGEWHTDAARGVMDPSGEPLCYPYGSPETEANDAAYIAACAGAAEAGWRSTIAAIDGLGDLENQCNYFADGTQDATPRDQFANELLGITNHAVNAILTAWEGSAAYLYADAMLAAREEKP